MAQTRSTSHGQAGSGDAGAARIGSGARVRGRIHGDGDLLVEGQVEGDLSIRGELTLAEGGSIHGDTVEAQSVVISGALEGDVAATSTVRLLAGARVRGNLRGSSVAIDEGARFSGRLDCEFELPPELEGSAPRAETRGRPAAARR
jgi:cytoskeletal protein CcmA (bactofilin family)